MDTVYTIIILCIPAIALSWVLPAKYHLLPASLVTVLFLCFHSYLSLVCLLVNVGLGYSLMYFMPNRRAVAYASVGLSSAVLITYKIYNTHAGGLLDFGLIGLSYYSFRQIHLAIEYYKEQIGSISLMNYVNYLLFIPTFIIGPINTYGEFEKDSLKRRWDSSLFSIGFERILYGLVKISLLGNYIFSFRFDQLINEQYFSEAQYYILNQYLNAVIFTGNAYFQFSGFSDVAIGLSALFGYRIIENFNYPFLSQNIAEFWTRWHISLSSWCKNYVFLPVLGKTRNVLISLGLSMLVLGLWHEISLKYLLWSVIQALAIFAWNKYKMSSIHIFLDRYKWNFYLGLFLNFNFVVLSFYILYFNSFSGFVKVIMKIIEHV